MVLVVTVIPVKEIINYLRIPMRSKIREREFRSRLIGFGSHWAVMLWNLTLLPRRIRFVSSEFVKYWFHIQIKETCVNEHLI